MKELIIYISIILTFNACQGRSMPSQPVVHTTEHTKKQSINSSKSMQKKTHKTKIVTKEKYLPLIVVKKKIVTVKDKPKIKKSKLATLSTPMLAYTSPINKNLPPLPSIPDVVTKPNKILELSSPSPKKKNNALKNNKLNNILNNISKPRQTFSGGGIMSGLDIGEIRIGKSSDYTSIILDSYIFKGKNILSTKKASSSGTYLFTYEPSYNQIIGLIDGYDDFSALQSNLHELFKANTVIKNIKLLNQIGKDGIKFVIKLHKKVRVNIFDVKNPGRIIINLFPQ